MIEKDVAKSFILRKLYQNYQQNIDDTLKKDLFGNGISQENVDAFLQELVSDNLVKIKDGSAVQITPQGVGKVEESCSCD